MKYSTFAKEAGWKDNPVFDLDLTPGEWRGRYRARLLKLGMSPSKAMTAALIVDPRTDMSPEDAADIFLNH